MLFENKTAFILSALSFLLLLPFTFSEEFNSGADSNIGALSDDEISYALSELSVDELNNLSKLIDVLSQETSLNEDDNLSPAEMTGQTRFKRESSDATSSGLQHDNNQLSKVSEEYIRQLEDSFPNIIDQTNQEEKEKNHIRVKRDKIVPNN